MEYVKMIEIISLIVGALGLGVSVWTLMVALMFKKRINKRNEKQNFSSERKHYCEKFSADLKTYKGKTPLYNKFQLNQTRLLIDEFKKKYTFVDSELKRQLENTYNFIIDVCEPEAIEKKTDNLIKLCEEINAIIILIEKEEIY